MWDINLHSQATDDNGYIVSWNGHEVSRVQFFENPRTENNIVSWNTGAELVGVFCLRYRKAARKRRNLKKWIRRFGALYFRVPYPYREGPYGTPNEAHKD